VGVMARGRLVACGPPQEITQARDEVCVQIEQGERDEALNQGLRAQIEGWGGTVEATGETGASLRVPSALVYRVLGVLEQRRARLVAVTPQRETLEDAFLRLVGG